MVQNSLDSTDFLLEIAFDKKGEIKFANDHFMNLFTLEKDKLISYSIFYFLNESQKKFLLKNWSFLFNGASYQIISDVNFQEGKAKTLLISFSLIDLDRISIKAYDLSCCKEIEKSVVVLNRALKMIGDSNFFYSNLKLDLDVYFSNLKSLNVI